MNIPIEDVKIQFEKAHDVPFEWFGFDGAAFLIGAYILLIIILFVMILAKAREGYGKIIFGFILLFTLQAVFAKAEAQEKIGENIRKWRQEYAIPYINSLPTEKRNVVFIKIEASATQEIKDNGLYLRSEEVRRTPLTVSYKDKGEIITRTDWYGTNMGLSLDEKPYLEFVILPEPVGVTEDGKKAEFWAGEYNHQVFMPNNYQFTEIK